MAGEIPPVPSSPSLTVGIPAYNAGATLEAAIRSILRQTWRGTLEILIVDDGSTDDTVAVATRMAERYGAVRVVRHDRNRGRPTARNTILREARGRYLTWMDADDEWYPNKLAVQFDQLFAHEAAPGNDPHRPVICMCAFDWKWSHAGKPSHRTPDLSGDQLKGLLNGRIGAYLWTMLGTLQAFRDVGDFDEKLPRLQDLDFTIRFVARGGQLIMSDPRMPLCLYHKDDDGKPGRVIAESMAHIRRKHRPLFLQYGPRFLRGARRQHFLLVSRHGYRNEGRWYGLQYAMLASLVVPGRFLGAALRAARLRPPLKAERPRKLDTVREAFPSLDVRARNDGGPVRVDLIVMGCERSAEDLRSHLRRMGHAARQDGLWYVTSGVIAGDAKRRDHSGLLDVLHRDPAAGQAAASRLARAAATCNDDGQSTIVFVGAPIDLESASPEALDAQVVTLRTALETIARSTHEVGLTLNVHLVVPDSETLIWRRYARALESGLDTDFDAWLAEQPPGLGRVLDLGVLGPLGSIDGGTGLHLHLLGDGATLDGLRRSILCTFDRPPPWPGAEPVPLAAPTRHGGLPFFERLLHRYERMLGRDDIDAARRRFWVMPCHEVPSAPAPESLEWLRSNGNWSPLAQRFPNARCHWVAGTAEPRLAPEHFRYPVASFAAYERSAAEWRMLKNLATVAA